MGDATLMTDSICFAEVGCGATAPSGECPAPSEPASLLISVVIPIILMLLVAVTIFYCRTSRKKKRLKDSMTEMQKRWKQ